MTTYVVTTANWNDPAFWSAITEGAGGHTLDFSSLPANYTVDFDKVTGRIIISDGTSTFTVGEAGYGGASDATLGGTTLWDFFETLSFGDGDQRIVGDGRDETFSTGAGQDTIETGFGDDTVFAGGGNDSVFGDANNDVLYGEGGDDTLDGGIGSDLLYGGDGNDLVQGGGNTGNPDTLYGGNGNDTVIGGNGAGNDSLFGEAGNDVLDGQQGNDTVDAGTGSDTIQLTDDFGDDVITGGEDGDGLDVDVIDASGITTGGVSVSVTNEAGSVTQGTDSASFSEIESFVLTDQNDTLTAFGTDDLIVDGGGGNDSIQEGNGNNTLSGGDGDDIFEVGFGTSTIDGGTGTDTLSASVADDAISVTFGGTGFGTYNDLTDSDSGTFTSIEAVIGTTGNDIVNASADSGGVDVSAGDGSDTITGGSGNDTLQGGAGNDFFSSTDGDDLLVGGLGNDTLFSGAGADTMLGGDGNDLITQSSNDSIDGGEGIDTLDATFGTFDDVYTFTSATGGVYNSATGGGGTFENMEVFISDGGAETYDASLATSDLTISTGADDDTITGGSGNDQIDGGGEDDTFLIQDGYGNDTITGGETAETNGDILDASAVTADTTLDLTAGGAADPESGTLSDGTSTAQFTQVESVTLGSGNDSVTGSSGNDSVATGAGADTVDGGAGNDSFDLGASDGAEDTVVFSDGDGDDTITNFEGPIDNGDGTFTGQDQLDLSGVTDTGGNQINVRDITVGDDGFGNALLSFPNGESITLVGIAPSEVSDEDALAALGVPAPDDIVEGTAGADTIDASYTGDPEGDAVDANDNAAGNNDDVVQAGDGNDSVFAGLGNDSVEGGNNDDTLFGQDGDDTLLGGDGNDSLDGDDGSAGNDSLDGGAGNDTLIGDGGNDTLLGGSGDDDIFVSSGDNLIDGGTGADEVFAGTGNDTITVDQGDTVLGAGGDDVFILEDIDTTGTGNAAINLTGGETGETNGDTLILTSDVAYSDITFTNTDDAAGGLSGNFTMADGTVVTFSEMENIICFTPGAMILTSHGERPVETLQKGDLVVTRDQGLRPIRWIGKRTVPGRGRFAPIRVGTNALDSARAGLLVSPQHRILFTGYRAELLFGDAEVLVPAKHLIDGKDVIQEPCEEITYIHLMFDHHEVIYADGIASESFYAGDMGLSAIDTAAREELFSIFPELRTAPGHHLETARPCLKKHEAALLADDSSGPFL